jgi:hypothetical protein
MDTYSASTKRQCYASSLGSCDATSREHVVSKALFGEGVVFTKGLRIPENRPVGIEGLVANILCQAHNSELSPLDAEFKKLGDACEDFVTSVKSASVKVDGRLIERWLLKLAVGSMASGWIPGLKIMPPADVVESLFGRRHLPDTVSLFGIADIGRETPRAKCVTFDFFFGKSPGSMGIVSSIHGLPLLLSSCLEDPQGETRARKHIGSFDVSGAELRRHPSELIVSNADRSARLSIFLEW